jgi:hypothetical protein
MATKLSVKLHKVDEDITITQADNGYIVSVSGRDTADDWANTKIICNSIDEVVELIKEASSMERS